jgi:hypothetical protein
MDDKEVLQTTYLIVDGITDFELLQAGLFKYKKKSLLLLIELRKLNNLLTK